MVFKRRKPLGWLAWMREMVYPRGGFKRATRYVIHRRRSLLEGCGLREGRRFFGCSSHGRIDKMAKMSS